GREALAAFLRRPTRQGRPPLVLAHRPRPYPPTHGTSDRRDRAQLCRARAAARRSVADRRSEALRRGGPAPQAAFPCARARAAVARADGPAGGGLRAAVRQ